MNDTVTAKEIAEALQVAVMTITRRAEREQWPFEKRSGRGGGKAYLVASLPEPVRIALDRHLFRPALGIIQGGKSTPATTSAAASPAPLSTAPPEPALPPAALSKAALKADLVKAYLEAKAWGRKHGKSMAQCREAFVMGYNARQLCPAIREQLGETSWKTLERWAVELRRARTMTAPPSRRNTGCTAGACARSPRPRKNASWRFYCRKANSRSARPSPL